MGLLYEKLFNVLRCCIVNKMSKAFRRLSGVIAILSWFSCVAGDQIYDTSGSSLYVAEDPQKSTRSPTVINRIPDDPISRRKRDVTTPPPATAAAPVLQKNISTWVIYYFLIKFNLSPKLYDHRYCCGWSQCLTIIQFGTVAVVST